LEATQPTEDNIAEALKVSERQYRRLFEAARDGILILDSEHGKVTDANPFMTEILGYSRAELLGKELWEIGLLQDTAGSQEAFRQLKRDGYIRYEDLPLVNRSGERRQVEFISNVYRENGHTVIQCNIRDITNRKREAAALAAAALIAEAQGRQAAVLEERARQAREIHDTLAQGFAGITTQLEAAEAAIANLPAPTVPASLAVYQVQLEKVLVRIGKAKDLSRESLAEARRSVAALRSPHLTAATLSDALSSTLAQRVLGTETKGRYLVEGVAYNLPAAVEHCVLRVGQEAIANVVAHAQATQIDVHLCFEPRQVRLQVEDNGRGFDPNLPAAGRFGIIGMQERAERVGGALSIHGRVGKGTVVDLRVPVGQDSPTQESCVTDV
jgi:PAS domain S-box-containing protein